MGKFYHVTERENVADILENGFIGGWGDVGFGVYLYDNLRDTNEYFNAKGWDAGLVDPAIIEIDTNDVERVPVMSSEWDAEKYSNMWWHDMEEHQDDDSYRWKPHMKLLG